ncbi:hypothetical protein POV27_12470 [Aureisphaera galaxeae]|uniref:hypothetical protein n=1 Tax=Aureisphaera galaxeae TaxID=1538023 RepID=UPI0023508E6A|nr:hypothetical protein [Aureisphaera galaxeae]MDC8004868.1 hypothetical protein [Aureisphaera galaxeae]
MGFKSKEKKSYTHIYWGNSVILFSSLLFIFNFFFIWTMNQDAWGMNFTVSASYQPSQILWGVLFKYYTPVSFAMIPYSILLIVCGYQLRKARNWARKLLIPLCILGGLIATVFYIFIAIEISWYFLPIMMLAGVTVILFFIWNYIYKLVRFLKSLQ